MRKLLLFIALCIALALQAKGPRLFHISRSLNKNIVCYDARVSGGKIDAKNPIHVYWQNNEERPGEEDELNALQRRLAFGYKVKSAGGNEACVALVAYGKRPIRVCQRDKKWVALVEINGHECRLREIYVKAKGAMSVEYIELRGTATADGKQQKETIRP